MAVIFSSWARRHPEDPDADHNKQFIPSPAPGQGKEACAIVSVYLVYGRNNVFFIFDFDHNRCVFDVLLPSECEGCILGHEGTGVSCAFWFTFEESSPMGGASDGDNGMVSPVQGIYDRFIQAAQGV